MDLMENYNKALKDLYDYFGFEPDWVVLPIKDSTEMFWRLQGNGVYYSKTKEELQKEDGEVYYDSIYKQRFYKKHIWEGKELTMIFCDTHTDGVKYFRIFDNSKKEEGKKEKLIEEYITVISTGRGPVAAHVGVFQDGEMVYEDIIQTGFQYGNRDKARTEAKQWARAEEITLKVVE